MTQIQNKNNKKITPSIFHTLTLFSKRGPAVIRSGGFPNFVFLKKKILFVCFVLLFYFPPLSPLLLYLSSGLFSLYILSVISKNLKKKSLKTMPSEDRERWKTGKSESSGSERVNLLLLTPLTFRFLVARKCLQKILTHFSATLSLQPFLLFFFQPSSLRALVIDVLLGDLYTLGTVKFFFYLILIRFVIY